MSENQIVQINEQDLPVLGKRERPEEKIVSFELFSNDGSDRSSIALIALKNIFSRQLPKMPKDYIVRLVFDKRHISLAIKSNEKIIGGICYRPYKDQRFGEIAFCAITASEQVRGYGTSLMNQLKVVAQRDRIEYFLTYADNFAIGYFQKQGFSKVISMPRERWYGFIKDYDGGTLMECYVHPAIDYLNVKEIVNKQRKFILDRLNENSKNNIIYDSLTQFENGIKVNSILEIPGVLEGGWTFNQVYKGSNERDRSVHLTRLNNILKIFIDKLKSNKYSKYFHSLEVQGSSSFYDISNLVKKGEYYRCKEAFFADINRMIEYAKSINQDNLDVLESINLFAEYSLELSNSKENTIIM